MSSLRTSRQISIPVILGLFLAAHTQLCAKAATPQAIDQKLDRIFLFAAVDETGEPVIVKPTNKAASPSIYASVSTTGLNGLKSAIRSSTNPSAEDQLRLTPVTLAFFLQTWSRYRSQMPTLAARIISDGIERESALRLLQQQGFSAKEALEEMGSDVPVFCPVPAIYAEDKNTTTHNRTSGKKFIPCSFSLTTLMSIVDAKPNLSPTTVVPIALWKLINALKDDKDSAITTIEILAHPTLLTGMEAATEKKNFILGSPAARSQRP